jgi:hypothetical protein
MQAIENTNAALLVWDTSTSVEIVVGCRATEAGKHSNTNSLERLPRGVHRHSSEETVMYVECRL